jgi:hypothetical protein
MRGHRTAGRDLQRRLHSHLPCGPEDSRKAFVSADTIAGAAARCQYIHGKPDRGYGVRILPPKPAAEHSHPFGWDWPQGTAIPPLRMSSCLLAIASSAAGKLLHKTDGHPRGRCRGSACMLCGPRKTPTQSGETSCKSLSGKGFFVTLIEWRLSDMPRKAAS